MSDKIRAFLDHAAQHVGQPYSWPGAAADAQPLIDFHRLHFGNTRMEGEGAGGGEGGAGGAGSGGQGGDGGGGSYTPPATQADLDRIITERLTRERAKFGDYDQLKAAATELQQIKDGQKSEVDRLKDERDNLKKTADDAVVRVKSTARNAAVVVAAAKAGAIDPQEIVALLPADAVTVADDGTVTGAEAAVTKLKEQKAHLFGRGRSGGPPNHGAGPRENASGGFGSGGRAEAQKRFGDKSKQQ